MSTPGNRKTSRSRGSPSPGARKYQQQKDQIMNQMQTVMQKTHIVNESQPDLLTVDDDDEVNNLS